jgi:hypothetical protein
MALPGYLTQTGVGRSGIWVPDYFEDPFNVGIGCIINGTVTYNVEHCFEPVDQLVLQIPWAVAAGGSKLTFPQVPIALMQIGRPVVNLTNPTTIGAQTVTAFDANTVTLSGTLPGTVQAGDKISFLVWFQNTGISGVSANAQGNYAFPVRGISLNVTAGAGSVTGELVQATGQW